MRLVEVGAALKGMFTLRANSAAYQQLLSNLDELKTISASTRHVSDFDETMRRMVEEVRK